MFSTSGSGAAKNVTSRNQKHITSNMTFNVFGREEGSDARKGFGYLYFFLCGRGGVRSENDFST